eukprot:403343600
MLSFDALGRGTIFKRVNQGLRAKTFENLATIHSRSMGMSRSTFFNQGFFIIFSTIRQTQSHSMDIQLYTICNVHMILSQVDLGKLLISENSKYFSRIKNDSLMSSRLIKFLNFEDLPLRDKNHKISESNGEIPNSMQVTFVFIRKAHLNEEQIY